MAHDTRWAIYIDIEGFGALYDREDTVLLALADLMDAIFLVGTNCHPESPERIFAHQTGDGFVIVSEFSADTLDLPVSIAIALLRHVCVRGRFAKAAIAEGNFADIKGCYPEKIRDAEVNGRVSLGGGFMTVFPVMGTALINAVAVSKRSPSGALLTIDASQLMRLPSGSHTQPIDEEKLISIDWVHSTIPLVAEIQKLAGLRAPTADDMKRLFSNYIQSTGVKQTWKANTNWFLSIGLSPCEI